MKWTNSRTWANAGAVGVLLLLTSLAFSGTVIGPPPPDNPGQPFEQIMDAIEDLALDVGGLGDAIDDLSDQLDDLESAIDDLGDDLDDVADDVSDILTEVTNIEAKLDHLDIEVVVYVDVCGDGASQCGFNGHSYAAAAKGNHNPIRVFLSVTLHGQPVSGLTDADIVFNNGFVAPGGPGAIECDATDCGGDYFQASGNIYGFFLHPAAAWNWQDGQYFGEVNINYGGITGVAAVNWDIP